MTQQYAKLKDGWLLRGWSDLPWTLVNWRTGERRKLDKRSFYVAEAADGNTDFMSLAFLPAHRAILEALIAEDIALQCVKGDAVESYQRYRMAENPRVKSVHWSITGYCNLNCRHCYLEAPSRRYGNPEFEKILRILDQFEAANVYEVTLTGGEPFLRKDLLRIIGELAQRRIRVSEIYSNGLLLTESVLSDIKKFDFFPTFQISFDGCGGHDYMRGAKGVEHRVVAAIRTLRTAGFPVAVSTSIDKVNIKRLIDTYDLLKDLDIQYWCVCPPVKTGNWSDALTSVSLDQEVLAYEPVLDRWIRDKRPFGIKLGGLFSDRKDGASEQDKGATRAYTPNSCDCGICQEQPFLLPDGTLLPCPGYVDTALQAQMPNLYREPFIKAWSNSAIRKLADLKKQDLLVRNNECRSCKLFGECGMGCRSSALLTTGDIMQKDPRMCEIIRKGHKKRFRLLVNRQSDDRSCCP